MQKGEILKLTYHLQRDPSERKNYSQELIRLLKPEGRTIELAICVSICNEPYEQFLLSLKSTIKSVALLCQNRSEIHPSNILVFLMQDGKQKVSESFLKDAQNKIVTRELFSQIQNSGHRESYDSEVDTLKIKHHNYVLTTIHQTPSEYVGLSEARPRESRVFLPSFDSRNPERVIPMTQYAITKWSDTQTLHCFCSLTSIHHFSSEKDQDEIIEACLGDVPQMWLIYGVKETNLGKLDTHRLFFEGFCKDLDPHYCILTDCGTEFQNNTIFGFFRLGEVRPSMAGACIEIETEWQWTPLVMAQFFEYKIDQVLKSAEGVYGLVQILPGALQFLKWEAVQGKPLNMYCEGTEEHNYSPTADNLGIFKRNVFLTEDKLMTTLLMTRDDKVYTVEYLPGTLSSTDVPKTTTAILRQRRRWLNGGFSCTVYGFGLFFQEYKESMMRKTKPCLGFMLFLQLLFYLLLIFIQSSIAFDIINFWYLVIPLENIMKGEKFTKEFSITQNVSYFLLAFVGFSILVFLLSLFSNTRNKIVTLIFDVLNYVFIVFNVLRLSGMFLIFHLAITDEIKNVYWIPQLPMGIISIFSLTMVTITLILIKPREVLLQSPCKFFLGFLTYLLQYNTFFYFVKIYLISNYHDVSWGSRAGNKLEGSQIGQSYRRINFVMLVLWLLMNGSMVYLFIFFPYKQYIFYFIIFMMMVQQGFRCAECIVFQWKWHCRRNQKIYGSFKEFSMESVPVSEYREYLLSGKRDQLSTIWQSSDETQSRSGKLSEELSSSQQGTKSTTTTIRTMMSNSGITPSGGTTSEEEKDSDDKSSMLSFGKESSIHSQKRLKFSSSGSSLFGSEKQKSQKASSMRSNKLFQKKLNQRAFSSNSDDPNSEDSLMIEPDQKEEFGRFESASTAYDEFWKAFDMQEAMRRPVKEEDKSDGSFLSPINREKQKD